MAGRSQIEHMYRFGLSALQYTAPALPRRWKVQHKYRSRMAEKFTKHNMALAITAAQPLSLDLSGPPPLIDFEDVESEEIMSGETVSRSTDRG